MMKSIRDFMADCPLLSEISVNINCLEENAVSGSVDNVSSSPVIKTYTDGSSLRQLIFEISLRQNYGQEMEKNSNAITLLEQIADWIENQNKVGILPALSGNRNSVSLEIFKTGRVKETTADTAKYRLQCKLVYYQE